MKNVIFVIFIIFVMFTSCSEKENSDEVVLKMVFVPASEKAEVNDFKSLMDIVAEQTGYKFEFISVTDYNAAVEAMRAGRADIAWYGAATYVIATEIANAEAFAAGVPKGKEDAGYYTYFVVRSDNSMKTLEDAKGSVLALNSIGSTSGDYIPQVELIKIGLNTRNKNDFESVFYAGSHDASLMSVVNGQADICGTSSHNYHARIADGTIDPSSVRILHKSSKVPPAPLAYSTKLPLEVRNKIQDAVLNAHNYGTIGGWGGEMERYIKVHDSDFDIMRDVRKIVEENN